MSPVAEFIESGILELYVMGTSSAEENLEVEQMAARYPEVKQELEQISLAMEHYAQANSVKPRATVKALVMATIDYMERMRRGELPEAPPVLTQRSRASDYDKWLSHKDAVLPAGADGIYARIIGYTPVATTAILWIKEQTEQELHHDEYERFLILEGSCQIKVGEKEHTLSAGDFFDIPLHTPHQVFVTSDIPCKAILQRLNVE
jgi:mannose-6-phosphate isomerase-like protein (cupin superfamily)